MRPPSGVRASLAGESFATESTTAAATAEERKSQSTLEEAALDAAVAITQIHGFFGETMDSLSGLGADMDAMQASLVRISAVTQSIPAAKRSSE